LTAERKTSIDKEARLEIWEPGVLVLSCFLELQRKGVALTAPNPIEEWILIATKLAKVMLSDQRYTAVTVHGVALQC
jgi:hypothetical protein